MTTYDYDSVGNLTKITPPGPLGATTYSYDALSRVKTVTDGKGQTRTYSYDNMDRVTGVNYPGPPNFAYGYDANGNTTGRIDPQGWWSFGYDEANRLVSQTGPESYSYAYDKVGNPTSLTDPTGTTTYTYTPINELATLTDPNGAVTSFAYAPNHGSWRTDVDYPNGVSVDMTQDASGRVTRITARRPGGAIITDDTYSFENTAKSTANNGDTALRRTWTETGDTTVTYAYDALNRLTQASRTDVNNNPTGAQYAYGYDGAGNRTSRTVDGATTSYGYNDADQIGGATHDANGNITQGTYGLASASYNSVDQTTSLTPDGGTALAQEHAGTTQTLWRSSGNRDFHTSASTGITQITDTSQSTSYTREPDGTLVSMTRGGDTYYYTFDGRGSVVTLTNPSGQPVNAYRYSPYGAPEITLETLDNPWRHNAGYTIDGTLYKYGARYYDSSTGRWTQVDPIRSEPRYAYAGNDPVNRFDPSGTIDIGFSPVDVLEEVGHATYCGVLGGSSAALVGAGAGTLPAGFPALLAGAGGLYQYAEDCL